MKSRKFKLEEWKRMKQNNQEAFQYLLLQKVGLKNLSKKKKSFKIEKSKYEGQKLNRSSL